MYPKLISESQFPQLRHMNQELTFSSKRLARLLNKVTTGLNILFKGESESAKENNEKLRTYKKTRTSKNN